MHYKEVVFLQPGFLGFDRFKNFSYFDHRVVAMLRNELEQKRGYQVPVLPLPTCPSSTLATRQAQLLKVIRKFDESKYGGADQYHIIGHSTGGVDAALLLNEAPLKPQINCTECTGKTRFAAISDWANPGFTIGGDGALDPNNVRSRIGTVISLSAPQWGTSLTTHPVTRAFRSLLPTPKNLFLLADWLPSALNAALIDDFIQQGFSNSLQDARASLTWLSKTFTDRELVDCLRPEQMAAVQKQANYNLPQATLKSVVTAVAKPDESTETGMLFDKLYEACAEQAPSPTPENFKKTTAVLEAAMSGDSKTKLIKSPAAAARESDMRLSDGIVSSARQLVDLKNPKDELIAVVLADHLDVLGHYPIAMYDFYSEKLKVKTEQRGILKSGSGFRDSEFLDLWRTIAAAI